eukprot:6801386-Alexandrium_andersonii.AAC.1
MQHSNCSESQGVGEHALKTPTRPPLRVGHCGRTKSCSDGNDPWSVKTHMATVHDCLDCTNKFM